jgi:hypothetical protein
MEDFDEDDYILLGEAYTGVERLYSLCAYFSALGVYV